jgi:hypothetical protein
MEEPNLFTEMTAEDKAEVSSSIREMLNVQTPTTPEKVTPTEVVTPTAEAPTTPVVPSAEAPKAEEVKTDAPFFEELPDVFKNTEAVEAKPFELPDDVKAALDAKDARLKELESHPLVQTIMKYGELKDFDLNKLAQAYSTTDYSKLGAKELVAEKLRLEYPSLTAEQIEDEVDNYLDHKGINENTSIVIKGEFEKVLRAELEAKKTTPEYIKALEEASKAIKPIDPTEQIKQVQELVESDKTELVNFATQLKGQKIYGNEITEEDINSVVKRFEYMFNPTSAPYTTSDNKFDTKAFFLDMYKATKYDADMKRAYELGQKDYVKAKANIDPMGVSTPTVQEQSTKSVMERIHEQLDNNLNN